MARTLIGKLIFKLRAEGLDKADAVVNAVRRVDRAANGLRSGVAPDWGVAFQRQLSALKLLPTEIKQVERSWIAMHDSMKSRSLDKALSKVEVSGWKTAVVGELAQVRAEHDRHFKSLETASRAHAATMREAYRSVALAGGFYATGFLGREALRAGSEESRQRAEAKFAGLSGDERGKIETRSDELSAKYRLPKALVLESLKDSTLNLPSIEDAIAVSDAKARALLLLANTFGAGPAVEGMRKFDRAMDNIEKVKPEEYTRMLENYMKMQQVIGKDIDPAAFEQAIKYSRIAGKVSGEDFLSSQLPLLISQVGGSNAGTQIRAFFDQFVVGRAPANALNKQRELGLREPGTDRLVGQDRFGENPIQWVYTDLLPALKAKGVDTTNEVELAKVVGELTNNRNSADAIMSAILNMEQWNRILTERFPKAKGLAAADDVQAENPFAAYSGFTAALGNLSAAMLPMSTISAGLNSLADGINVVAEAARQSPAFTAAMMAGAGYGTYKAGQFAFGKMTDMFGLKSSALALDGSAAALMRAAAALGGAGVIDKGEGAGKRKSSAGWLGTAGLLGGATTAALAGAMSLGGDTAGNNYADASEEERERLREEARGNAEIFRALPLGKQLERVNAARAGETEKLSGGSGAKDTAPSWLDRFLFGKAAEPTFNFREHMAIDPAAWAEKGAADAPPPALAAPVVIMPPTVAPGPGQAPAVPMVRAPIAAPARAAEDASMRQLNQDVASGAIEPARPTVDGTAIAAAVETARAAGTEITAALSVTATPTVNTSSLDATLSKVHAIEAGLARIGAAAQRAKAAVGVEMRRNFADAGG